MSARTAITIENGYGPGFIGRIAELHGRYYHDHWDFGLYFEAKVATELAAFMQRFDPHRDGVWRVLNNQRIEGSLVIDGIDARAQGAHLRWFILSDAVREKGQGRELLDQAIDFCRRRAYARVFLWTFEGLDRARYLYESVGFELVKAQPGTQWGKPVTEQQFELTMDVA